MRPLIGAARLLIFFLSGLVTIAIQSTVMTFTKGMAAYWYPRHYHAFMTKVFGIKVIVEGAPEHGRNVMYVGNHVSYLDIQVVGSLVEGAFVAKKDVENWPFIGLLGKQGSTLYISRNPADAQKETQVMQARLDLGTPLIIFPEGTSSDGTLILPFKSSFFEIFLNRDLKIQPFTISVLEVDGITAGNPSARDKYAWYGDMSFEPHLWTIAKAKGAVIKVTFHEPLLSRGYSSRKELSKDAFEAVCKGLDLSTLSQ